MSLLEQASVKTRDAYGDKATVVIGHLDTTQVIVPPYVRNSLNANGAYDGTTTTKTQDLLARKGTPAISDRLMVQVEARREATYGHEALIGQERIDFQSRYAMNQNFVAWIYNITTF